MADRHRHHDRERNRDSSRRERRRHSSSPRREEDRKGRRRLSSDESRDRRRSRSPHSRQAECHGVSRHYFNSIIIYFKEMHERGDDPARRSTPDMVTITRNADQHQMSQQLELEKSNQTVKRRDHVIVETGNHHVIKGY